ncbi:MAG: HTTM domain-containing protein [Gemmatimonadetes bacterium]|nr:HTTM domain-containing protein [Gemmatimonadota bacterium]
MLAFSFLASLALSMPLWLTRRDYPHVPVIEGLPQPPAPLDAILLAAIAVAVVGVAVLPRPRHFLQAVLVIGAVWALLDQNRWQPYFAWYLVGMLCLLLGERSAGTTEKTAPAWHMAPLQLMTCCMYTWSGVHKFNHRYLSTDFILTAKPLLGWLGTSAASLPPRGIAALAVASALLELGFGVLLAFPRFRRVGVVGLTLMHLFILLMIGPLGTGWNRVVWPWNVAAIAALWLLFWPRATGPRLAAFLAGLRTPRGARVRRGAAKPAPRGIVYASLAVALVFGILPALSFAERWYASLSFQLYAGKERIALLYYDSGRPGAVPAAAARAARTPGQVNLAAWSIDELNAAPVLEERVLLSLARALARRAPDADVRLLIASPPSLVTGERKTRFFAFPAPALNPVDVSSQYKVDLDEGTGAELPP